MKLEREGTRQTQVRASEREDSFARRVLVSASIIAAVVISCWLLWVGQQAFFIFFASILWAIVLAAAADSVSRYSGLSYPLSLGVVLILILVMLGAAGWLMFPPIAAQTEQLLEELPESLAQLRGYLSRYQWGRWLLGESTDGAGLIAQEIRVAIERATGVASAALSGIALLFIIPITGIYLAWQHALYTRGVVRLVPMAKRERAGEVLTALGTKLRWWLLGRIASMTVVGVLTTLGLWLLNLPMALTLGLLAGLLAFIPYIGPVLSAVPAFLLGFVHQPILALYVVILYSGIQGLESYLITPLIQQRAANAPPALLIPAQVLLGIVFGLWGVVLAAPATVTGLVLVQMLYVRDLLGDREFEQH